MRTTIVRKLFPLLLALLCAASPSFGVTGLFGPADGIADLGYSGGMPTFTSNLPSMRQLGIFPNLAAYSAPDRDGDFLASNGTCKSTDYLALARIANFLATSPDAVRPFILDLTGVIFGYATERSCACDMAGNCSNQWVLRSDWVSRLQGFKQVSSNNFNSSTVLGIVLHQEIANVNEAVTDTGTINTIANQIKSLWPGIPVIGGYPTQAALSNYGMANTPLRFPLNLDYILTWDYSTGDPSVGQYPTMYNDPNLGLLRRLRWYQKLVYVVGIFNLDPTPHCPAQSVVGINNGARFDFILRKWCAWALKTHTDRTTTLLPYLWGFGAAHAIINWEYAHCGGSSLQSSFVSVANAAATGSSCWQ